MQDCNYRVKQGETNGAELFWTSLDKITSERRPDVRTLRPLGKFQFTSTPTFFTQSNGEQDDKVDGYGDALADGHAITRTASGQPRGPRTRGDGEAHDLGSLPSARASEGAGGRPLCRLWGRPLGMCGRPSSKRAFTLRVKRRVFSK